MCGICGFAERTPSLGADELRGTVRRMADTLAHRGPDDAGEWVDAAVGVALGHRRLSILDLSPCGAQPMLSSCGRYVLVYNGEIYNFRQLRAELETSGQGFRGHSDTEVLIEAIASWGVERAVERAQGMFAFALWDRKSRVLTLARDRLGKKPLYYGWIGARFVFASELKALEAHPDFRPQVDPDALGLLVRYSYVPAPHSIYRDVRKLAPATLVALVPERGPDDLQPRSFWSARAIAEHGGTAPFTGSPDEAADALDAHLSDAVECRMVADVPLGALLSGGVDSSAVVAQMQALSTRPIKTFSIGFDEAEYNEAGYAREIASHLGTDHRELIVRSEDARAVIPSLPRLYDEPFADTSQIPTFLVSRLAREDVTVALSGDGGDELFAGYKRYFRCLQRWRWLSLAPASTRAALARRFDALAARGWSDEDTPDPIASWRAWPGRLGRVADSLAASSFEDLFARSNARCRDAGDLVRGAGNPATVFSDPSRWPRDAEPLQWMMTLDLAGNLAEDILTKVDRASMGVSLEVRSPLLDQRLVEFAWSLPLSLRAPGGQPKWLLKKVLAKRVPRELTERPKMGFGVPIGSWLRGPLRDWAESLLAEDRLRREGYLCATQVRRIWHQHLSGWRDWRFLLWNILMFQAWLEERADRVPGGHPAGSDGRSSALP